MLTTVDSIICLSLLVILAGISHQSILLDSLDSFHNTRRTTIPTASTEVTSFSKRHHHHGHSCSLRKFQRNRCLRRLNQRLLSHGHQPFRELLLRLRIGIERTHSRNPRHHCRMPFRRSDHRGKSEGIIGAQYSHGC